MSKPMDTTYNLSTYKGILETIIAIEEQEDRFRRIRSYFLFACVFVVLGEIILLAPINMDFLLSEDIVGIALIPIFNYLFTSYEQDYITQRKLKIITAYNNMIDKNGEDSYRIENSPVKVEEIKEIINNILKSKL